MPAVVRAWTPTTGPDTTTPDITSQERPHMADATEAPATMAEGPTSHTQNPVPRLSAPQLRMLHRAVDPKRIGKDDKGFAHMEAWDIKRYLLRIFGFAGYATENRELALVREIEYPSQQQGGKSRWTVVYRAQVRLTVKDVHGHELSHWDGEAAGGGNNLPKLDDAHDMAMKTASSQALKRAATHLGDAFGLSLYNNGSRDAVVGFSAAHPPADWEKIASPLPELEDPPVRPEQGADADEPAIGRGDTPQEPAPTPTPPTPAPEAKPEPGSKDTERAAHIQRLMAQVVTCWSNPLALSQIRADAEKHKVIDHEVQGPPPGREWMPFRSLLDGRFAELKTANAERSAA